MKRIILVLFICIAGVSARAQFTEARLQASGLTCSMCSKAVKQALEKLGFVESVTVDLKTQEYKLRFRQEAELDIDAIKTAVEDAGFSIASLNIAGRFDGLQAKGDAHLELDGKFFHILEAGKKPAGDMVNFVIVDRGFVTTKQYKKYSTLTKAPCFETGRASSCCTSEGIKSHARVYHVII